jgi:hypothetical protein
MEAELRQFHGRRRLWVALVTRAVAPVVALAAFAAAPPAHASEPLSDRNVEGATLRVNRAGEALVTYRRQDGTTRRVLVWGAVNSNHPSTDVAQVRFRYDYAGGWGKYRKLVWRTFRNACRPYDGPALPYLVAACKAPDGTYWALQRWQRMLPLLGFDPWLPDHTAWDLHVSHWSGALGTLEISTNWTYGGAFESVFGRVTYLGVPVHGFGSTRTGNPTDRYGRNVYIDTLDSAYGPGWRRESGILTHRPTGTFCHSFVPQKPFPGYPSGDLRPAAPGKRYRVTVMGPGVTPVATWEDSGLGQYDAARDAALDPTFDRIMAGDAVCAAER